MKQSYKDKLRNSAKLNSGKFTPRIGYEVDEWSARCYRSARRILSATLFLTTSESAYRLAENTILSYIGLYYSVFHMGVAMLSVDHTTPLPELRELSHKKLLNLINSKLCKPSLIADDYLNLLTEIKEIREDVNYILRPYPDDLGYDGNFNPKDDFYFYYSEIDSIFDTAVQFITEVNNVIEDIFPLKSNIMIRIGDTISDDTYLTYLSSKDEESVIKYLLSKNLTT